MEEKFHLLAFMADIFSASRSFLSSITFSTESSIKDKHRYTNEHEEWGFWDDYNKKFQVLGIILFIFTRGQWPESANVTVVQWDSSISLHSFINYLIYENSRDLTDVLCIYVIAAMNKFLSPFESHL